MLMMIGMVTGVTLIASCDNHRTSTFSRRDSIAIAKIAESTIAKHEQSAYEFKDPQEFLVYVVHNRDLHSAEDVVFSLHDNVLSGIAYSLKSKNKPLSVISAYDEYIAHKSFYDGVAKGIPKEELERYSQTRVVDSAYVEGGVGDE